MSEIIEKPTITAKDTADGSGLLLLDLDAEGATPSPGVASAPDQIEETPTAPARRPMMREQLCMVLALHAGKLITKDLAADIVWQLMPDLAYDPSQFPKEIYHGYAFQAEWFDLALPELRVLHRAHFAETEKFRAGIELKPDYAGMSERERSGGLIQFTARTLDGELVGSICMHVYVSAHTGTLAAKEDSYFVFSSHRQGFTAIQFWKYMERCLESVGVLEITTDSKIVRNLDDASKPEKDVGKLNKYLGYRHVANVFHKLLKD